MTTRWVSVLLADCENCERQIERNEIALIRPGRGLRCLPCIGGGE